MNFKGFFVVFRTFMFCVNVKNYNFEILDCYCDQTSENKY